MFSCMCLGTAGVLIAIFDYFWEGGFLGESENRAHRMEHI